MQFRAVLKEAELKEHSVMEMVRIRMEDISEIAQGRRLGDDRYRCFCTCAKNR